MTGGSEDEGRKAENRKGRPAWHAGGRGLEMSPGVKVGLAYQTAPGNQSDLDQRNVGPPGAP